VKKGFGIILATVGLDAVGIGLVMPIIPRLLREVGHTGDLGWRFGAFLGLYALMQFLCAPVLGAISDKVGRRPVLLVSLAGAAIDYVFMALAPSMAWLFVGRAIAGITGANMAVAQAYIADITPEDQRARRYGLFSAIFGVGFIAGPVIGGLLGEVWVRAPFLAAAGLNGLNFALAHCSCCRSRTRRGAPDRPHRLQPARLAALGLRLSRPCCRCLLAFVVLALVGEIGGTIWVLYGEDKFAWSPWTIGLSLAGFGLFHAWPRPSWPVPWPSASASVEPC
jgi:DHA1 family tetracycline resistance protein-like MFS transporter